MHRTVKLSVTEKALRKLPKHVLVKLHLWVSLVGTHGLENVRRIPGYHDEPLSGTRLGQRSIRLSRSYRAFYRFVQGEIELVDVFEVNKHDY